MENKMNGAKSAGEKARKNSVKTAGRKKIARRPVGGKSPQAKIQIPKKSRPGLASVVVYLVITALAVGGGVYAWQKKSIQSVIESKEKEAQNLKYDLEEALDKTKKKLAGAENENTELKSENQELKTKAGLLGAAKMEFESSEYGFSFFYPAVFGEVSLEAEDGIEGRKIIGRFSDNPSLIFGGITGGYKTATSAKPAFWETQGFRKRWNSYYFKSFGSDTHEINPLKVIEAGGQEAILMDKNSFIKEGEESIPVDMGENIGFLFNLENEEFSGIGFLNSDFSKLTLDDFISLAESIKIKKL